MAGTEVAFVAEVWVDPEWYAVQQILEPLPEPGRAEVVALTSRSALVGRLSRQQDIHPDIDLGTDPGVSRRQSLLTSDGSRWYVSDLESANGTFVAADGDPLPTEPLPPGLEHPLDEGDGIFVGAWTRIVVRPARADDRPA